MSKIICPCTVQRVKLFCMGVILRTLTRLEGILHRNLDRLNSLWYRFSMYSPAQVSRWPHQTTGELVRVTYLRTTGANTRETCEILIVLLFIIMAVVPLAIVMTMLEIVNKRRRAMQQRNRIDSITMSTL